MLKPKPDEDGDSLRKDERFQSLLLLEHGDHEYFHLWVGFELKL